MKQAINQYLPVEFGDISLNDVKKIEFLFKQKTIVRTVIYPSNEAIRLDDTNIVQIVWSPEQTAIFSIDYNIELDTRVTLNDTDINPETPIVTFKINRSLFKVGDKL